MEAIRQQWRDWLREEEEEEEEELAFSNSSVFTAEQCERKATTEKFYSVFIRKRSSVNGTSVALCHFSSQKGLFTRHAASEIGHTY